MLFYVLVYGRKLADGEEGSSQAYTRVPRVDLRGKTGIAREFTAAMRSSVNSKAVMVYDPAPAIQGGLHVVVRSMRSLDPRGLVHMAETTLRQIIDRDVIIAQR
jgi:hypothetical protein